MAIPAPIPTLPIVRRGDPEEVFNPLMNEWVQKMPATIEAMNEHTEYATTTAGEAAGSASAALVSENNAGDSEASAASSASIAAATGNFKGLWSTQTGAATKPATYSHLGQDWRLLNDLADITLSEPSNVNVDYSVVLTVTRPNMLSNANFYQPSPTGLTVSVGGSDFNAGEQVFLNWFVSTGGTIGLSRDPATGLINATSGSIYQDIPKSGPLGEYTGALVASWGDNNGQPTEDGAVISIADMITFYRVTLTPNGCFSAKMEQGVVASRHDTAQTDADLLLEDIKRMALSQAISYPKARVGMRFEISDRGDGEFVVITGGTPNPWNVIQHDTLPLQFNLITNGVYRPIEWGVDITGAISSDTAFDAIAASADAAREPLTCNGDIILLNVDKSFPDFGITGNHKILGAKLEVSGRRNFKQLVGRGEYNHIKVSDSTYNRFSYAEMYFDAPGLGIIDINGGGSGTFWNTFDSMLGDMNLTVGDEDADNNTSINQNYFLNCRGHLHLKGGDVANTRPQEINQNWVQGIDTTGADITAEDLTTGWHILNESYLNQTNVISQWYAEGSGKKAIRGNFHVLSSFVDGIQSPYALPPTNHVLLNPDNSVRNQSDYFAAAHVNEIEGGSWDILNAADKGQPKGFSYSSFTPTVVADATEPSGLGFKFGGASAVDFSAIRFKLTNNLRGRYTVWFWMQSVSGAQSMQVDGGGSPASTGVDVFHDAGNGWRLYRISSPTRIDGNDDFFTIFNRSADSEFYVSTVWGTPFKTALLPYPSQPKDRVGVTDTGVASSIPLALPTGGRIINTNPNLEAPANIEWVKRSSGLIYLLQSIT